MPVDVQRRQSVTDSGLRNDQTKRRGFFYHDDELSIMAQDIRTAHQANLQGVVLGLLNADGTIDVKRSKPLIELAHSLGLGVTFHRAFDHCVNPEHALEEIIALGCERILTSGLARNAYLGIERLAQLVKQSAGRISIMAGAGINAQNVAEIALATGSMSCIYPRNHASERDAVYSLGEQNGRGGL